MKTTSVIDLVLAAMLFLPFTGCTLLRLEPKVSEPVKQYRENPPDDSVLARPWYADETLMAALGSSIFTIGSVIGHRYWYHGRQKA